MSLFTDVTFLQVCAALIAVGVIERALLKFGPDAMVGPEGWLIRTQPE
jgi:hypothetical protein